MSKVSILIPAYNVGEFIGRCIESAVNQTLKDIEIIVVNDGSTDDTPQIIESFANKDNRIVVISQENAGLSMARNVAIEKAKSEYILHLDGDDWLELNACEELFNRAIETDADIITFDSYYNSDLKEVKKKLDGSIQSCDNLKFIELILRNEVLPCVIRKLFRRSLYIMNNILHPTNISLGEDLATIVPLAYYSKKIVGLESFLYHYYERDTSITRKYSSNMFDIFKVIDLICHFLDEKKILLDFRDEIVFLKFFHIFLHRIVLYKTDSPLQRGLWKKWKDLRIQFHKNELYREWLKNKTFYLKLRILAYRYNYLIGRILSVFQKY